MKRCRLNNLAYSDGDVWTTSKRVANGLAAYGWTKTAVWQRFGMWKRRTDYEYSSLLAMAGNQEVRTSWRVLFSWYCRLWKSTRWNIFICLNLHGVFHTGHAVEGRRWVRTQDVCWWWENIRKCGLAGLSCSACDDDTAFTQITDKLAACGVTDGKVGHDVDCGGDDRSVHRVFLLDMEGDGQGRTNRIALLCLRWLSRMKTHSSWAECLLTER